MSEKITIEVRLVGADGSRSEAKKISVDQYIGIVRATFYCLGPCTVVASEHRCVVLDAIWEQGPSVKKSLCKGDELDVTMQLDIKRAWRIL